MNKLQIYNLFKKTKKLNRGVFLAIEGIDGSAKGTHTAKLEEYLKSLGYKVKKISFPDYSKPIGNVIASYLKGDFGGIHDVPHELICIAYAADRVRIRDEINSYLNNGYIILSDRYTYSSIFTAAKMEESKRIDFIEWLEDIEFKEMKVVRPDWNIFLYVDPQISFSRIQERGKREYQEGKEDIHENNLKLLEDTTKTYLDFAKLRNDWIVIDQMRDGKQILIDEVFQIIKQKVDKIINELEG